MNSFSQKAESDFFHCKTKTLVGTRDYVKPEKSNKRTKGQGKKKSKKKKKLQEHPQMGCAQLITFKAVYCFVFLSATANGNKTI